MIEFCKKNDISVTGYSPLGKPGKRPLITNSWLDPKVIELSEKYGKTPAQISLRFVVSVFCVARPMIENFCIVYIPQLDLQLQMGAAPIPKSATKSNIKENIDIFDFTLTDEEMNALQKIETGERVVPIDE